MTLKLSERAKINTENCFTGFDCLLKIWGNQYMKLCVRWLTDSIIIAVHFQNFLFLSWNILTRTAQNCLSKSRYIMLQWPILLVIPLASMNSFSLGAVLQWAVIYKVKYTKASVFLSWNITCNKHSLNYFPQIQGKSRYNFPTFSKDNQPSLLFHRKHSFTHCHQTCTSLFILLPIKCN